MTTYETTMREEVKRLFRIEVDNIVTKKEKAYVQVRDVSSDRGCYETIEDASVFTVRLAYRSNTTPLTHPNQTSGITTLKVNWGPYMDQQEYKYSCVDLEHFSWKDNLQEYDWHVLTEEQYQKALSTMKYRGTLSKQSNGWLTDEGAKSRLELIRKNSVSTNEALSDHIKNISKAIVKKIWHPANNSYPIIVVRGNLGKCPKLPFYYNWIWNEEDRAASNARFSSAEHCYCHTEAVYACIVNHWVTL